MNKLLDNPDTMQLAEVVRALNIRHIYNATDMVLMQGMTMIVYAVTVSLLWLILHKELYLLRAHRVITLLSIIVFLVVNLVAIKIIGLEYEAIGYKGIASPHQ